MKERKYWGIGLLPQDPEIIYEIVNYLNNTSSICKFYKLTVITHNMAIKEGIEHKYCPESYLYIVCIKETKIGIGTWDKTIQAANNFKEGYFRAKKKFGV